MGLKKKCSQRRLVSYLETTNWRSGMPKITVDGIEYNTEDLSENGKAQLASLQFLEAQMNKLNAEIAVYETARNTYISVLKSELENTASE